MITPIEISPASSPGLTKLAVVPAGGRKQLVFKLTDGHGKVIDLREEVPNSPAPAPDFSPQPPATAAFVNIVLRVKNGDIGSPSTLFQVTGALLDEAGFVEFKLTEEHTAMPGIFDGTIGRVVDGGWLTETWPIYLAVEPNAFQSLSGYGPLSIAELRLGLLDLFGTDEGSFSSLLDGTEFSDVEIAHAIRRAVDLWNETPPPVAYYTPQNFPYRYWWSIGASAILLRMGAARYRRNRLAYSAGGVSIDDQSKAQEYEQIAEARMQEFKDWMMREKVRINMDLCWSTGL